MMKERVGGLFAFVLLVFVAPLVGEELTFVFDAGGQYVGPGYVFEGQPLIVYVSVIPKSVLSDALEHRATERDTWMNVIEQSRALPEGYTTIVSLAKNERQLELPRLIGDARSSRECQYVDGKIILSGCTRLTLSTLGVPSGEYQLSVDIVKGEKRERAYERSSFPTTQVIRLTISRIETDIDRANLMKNMSAYYIREGELEKAIQYNQLIPRTFPQIDRGVLTRALCHRSFLYEEQGNRVDALAALVAATYGEPPGVTRDHSLAATIQETRQVSAEDIPKAISRASQLSKEYLGEDFVKADKAEAFFKAAQKLVSEGALERERKGEKIEWPARPF